MGTKKTALLIGNLISNCTPALKAVPFAFGVFLTLMCCVPQSAEAVNVYVGRCACQSTTDFTNAASAQSKAGGGVPATGTFVISSSASAKTAYIAVVPTRRGTGYAYPVDSNGNSLVGQSESTLEGFYGAVDIVLSGTNRNQPSALVSAGDIDFGTSTDGYISNIINADSQVNSSTTSASVFFPNGAGGDGILAEFTRTAGTSSWRWNGVARNSQTGQLLKRDGTPQATTTASGSGSGSVTVPGIGPGSGWTWSVSGDAQLPAVSITVEPPTGTGYVDWNLFDEINGP